MHVTKTRYTRIGRGQPCRPNHSETSNEYNTWGKTAGLDWLAWDTPMEMQREPRVGHQSIPRLILRLGLLRLLMASHGYGFSSVDVLPDMYSDKDVSGSRLLQY